MLLLCTLFETKVRGIVNSVVDSDPDLDPVPAFEVNPDTDPEADPDPGFWWTIIKKTAEKIIIFLKSKMLFTYPQATLKDIQATGEAFSPQKRNPSLEKIKFFYTFFYLK